MSDRPVFLERQSYRRRRIMDAVRLLPFLGAALWMVPLVWPVTVGPVTADAVAGAANAQAGPIRMSTALLYIFCVWGGMVCVAFGLWWRSRANPVREQAPPRLGSPD